MSVAPTCYECQEAKYDCKEHQGHLYCADCIERGECVFECQKCFKLSDEEPFVIESEDGDTKYCYYCFKEVEAKQTAF